MPTIPHGRYDDALLAFDETWYRWIAFGRALADAGTIPDESTFFALIELQFAADHWRERFVAALARLGMTLEDVLEPVG